MAIPRRLSRLPAATATTKHSTATLAVAVGGTCARPSTAALAAAATTAAAAGRTTECQSLLHMSRRRGASRREIVSSLPASSPIPQPQVFDLLIRTYTQSRKPCEAFRLLDHRVPIPAAASNALLAALSRAGWPHLTADAYRPVLSSQL